MAVGSAVAGQEVEEGAASFVEVVAVKVEGEDEVVWAASAVAVLCCVCWVACV